MSGSKIRLYGSTSGYVELQAPAVAPDGVLTLPTGTGGFGKTLQVVQTVKTDTFSTASTSFVDVTGLTVSITPVSSSSKILITVNAAVHAASGTNAVFARITRGGTAIYVGDAAGSRIQAAWDASAPNTSHMMPSGIVFLDSPATTSATTYAFQIRANAGTIYVNRGADDSDSTDRARGASSITVMEVAA